MLVKSEKAKTGAIYALYLEQNWIFTGGWDKAITYRYHSYLGCCCFTLHICFPLFVL
jgi:hypothetical protein